MPSSSRPEVRPDQVAMLVGGDEVYGVGTIEKIYAEGWPDLLFLCAQDGPMYRWLQERSARVELCPNPRFVASRSIQTLLKMASYYQATRRVAKQAAKILKAEGIRIVHTHWLPEQLVAGHLRRHGFKAVWQINNNMNRHRLAGAGPKLNHMMANWGADLLLPASDFIADNWRGCGVPIKTIRNSASALGEYVAPAPAPPVRCLVAGRLEASKGHHVAIEAVLAARECGLDVRLDLFGGPLESNPYADALKDRIRSQGAESAIRLMGFCDDLRQRHGDYNLGLQCRIDPEPCSLWVCETLVDGLPLVASATGGTPELIEEGRTGLLVPPDDPGALTEAIVSLAKDTERLAAMGEAAALRGRGGFTTDRMLRETLEAYQTLA